MSPKPEKRAGDSFLQISSENVPSFSLLKEFLKHPENLTYHTQILQNAVDFFKQIDGVEAIFVLGSLAKDQADIYSDIDLFVIFEDSEKKAQIRNHFLTAKDQIGTLLHMYSSHGHKDDLILYYQPFIKLEIGFRGVHEVMGKWKMGAQAKLVFDRHAIGKEILESASDVSFQFSRYEKEVKNMAMALPSFCFIIAGYVMRGEIITTIDFVAWIRRNLLRISGFLLGLWDEGTRRAELRFPEEVIEYYHQSRFEKIEEVWACLDSFLDWYSHWLVPKFEERGIIHAQAEVTLLRKIIEIHRLKYKEINEIR
ncbi:MAG: nucleotidyltransferase domain-containing protein [Promethearchaeota archaeon]|nr:MAG: nucleotidyltransferase domain-containing protein [Candidatus Lokiarchaeota archaeon]